MPKDVRFEMRMEKFLKSKLLAVAELVELNASELVEDILSEALDGYDYCGECRQVFPVGDLEGIPGGYVCRECVESEEPEVAV